MSTINKLIRKIDFKKVYFNLMVNGSISIQEAMNRIQSNNLVYTTKLIKTAQRLLIRVNKADLRFETMANILNAKEV